MSGAAVGQTAGAALRRLDRGEFREHLLQLGAREHLVADGQVASIGRLPVRSTRTEKCVEGVIVCAGAPGVTASGAAGGLYGVTRVVGVAVFVDFGALDMVLSGLAATPEPPAAYAV